ncbi:MAG TPA: TlpA disulfide reductase family protein [Candidatus Eremiobacteraceae bacterium]|jgi:peroxiredoxin/tetratricopeptide (TPR) repeat protein
MNASIARRLAPAFALVLALAAPRPAWAAAPGIGTLAPDFKLQSTSGRTMSLSDLRGHVVVLNFFATWCPPCRAETPDLVAAAKKYGAGSDVMFFGVDDREQMPLVQVWAKGKGVRFPLVMDSTGSVEEMYDVRAIPTTYILDRNGVIRYRQLDQLESSTLTGALDAVVADKPVPETKIAQTFDDTATSSLAAVRAAIAAGKPADAIDAGKKSSDKLTAIQSGDGSSSIDYFKATQELDALYTALGDAYDARAKTETGAPANADLAQEALQRGQVAEDQEQFVQAYADYGQAVTLDPSTATDAYNGLYLAAVEMKQHDKAVAAGKALAAAVPDDPESWMTLTSADLGAKDYPAALDASSHALALASAAYANKPTDDSAKHELARAWLKFGRAEIAAGNNAAGQAMMLDSAAAQPNSMVAEEANEQYAALEPADIAMTISGASAAHALKASPAKLWVLVKNPSSVARSVNLAATGLPNHWLLSFCYAKVCQPFKSTINLAANGSMRVELQVVPLADSGGPWSMLVKADGGSTASVTIASKTANAIATVSASPGT